MPYRHLHFRSLAKDLNLRTEIYNGEEHLVVPCIALVGDEVVYGLNAEGPEFIPAEELEFSTLGWSGRPVLPDHPANSTSTANDPHTLQLMQFGQIFYPRFEDKKLKIEAWLGKERAKKVTGATEIIEKVEAGEMIELSVGAIISLEKKNGTSPSGKPYQAVWHDVQSDHLAIGLNGSQGACNLEMGCGANRLLTSNIESAGESDVRMMHAERGDANMTPKPDGNPAAQPVVDTQSPAIPQPAVKAQSRVQKILSFASRLFRTNIEDEGLSDSDLRSKLWDVLYSTEPAFYGIEDVFQESMTVKYVTQPIVPVPTMYLWRRTFTVAEDGTVTINDDREEVSKIENSYMFLSASPAERANSQPCACQENDTNTQPQPPESKEDDTMADAPKTTTTTTDPNPTTPATAPTTPTTPAVPGASPTALVTEAPATATHSAEHSKELTEDEQIALLPAPVQAMVQHYRARDAKEREGLISALTKKQKVYGETDLKAMSTEQLRKTAALAGIGQETAQVPGDYSGRVLVNADEDEIKPVPDSWAEARKLRQKREHDNNTN